MTKGFLRGSVWGILLSLGLLVGVLVADHLLRGAGSNAGQPVSEVSSEPRAAGAEAADAGTDAPSTLPVAAPRPDTLAGLPGEGASGSPPTGTAAEPRDTTEVAAAASLAAGPRQPAQPDAVPQESAFAPVPSPAAQRAPEAAIVPEESFRPEVTTDIAGLAAPDTAVPAAAFSPVEGASGTTGGTTADARSEQAALSGPAKNAAGPAPVVPSEAPLQPRVASEGMAAMGENGAADASPAGNAAVPFEAGPGSLATLRDGVAPLVSGPETPPSAAGDGSSGRPAGPSLAGSLVSAAPERDRTGRDDGPETASAALAAPGPERSPDPVVARNAPEMAVPADTPESIAIVPEGAVRADAPRVALVLADAGSLPLEVALSALRDLRYPVAIALDGAGTAAGERLRAFRAAGFECLLLLDWPVEGPSAAVAQRISSELAALPDVAGVLLRSRANEDAVRWLAEWLALQGHALVLEVAAPERGGDAPPRPGRGTEAAAAIPLDPIHAGGQGMDRHLDATLGETFAGPVPASAAILTLAMDATTLDALLRWRPQNHLPVALSAALPSGGG